jgi:endothelin-converting enzyme/putative endopeptidase
MRLRPLVGLVAASLALIPAAALAAPEGGEARSFDLSALDTSVNPCENFYQYACGGWVKNNPIPADQSSWGTFNQLAERNRETLHQILEEVAANPTAKTRKIGDYYASCMDEQAVDAKGLAPLKPALDRIAALTSKRDLPATVAYLHTLGVQALFSFYSLQDYNDATRVIAHADQGGLGLPDRDYYFKDDAKSAEQRRAYVAHVQKMFELAGESPAVAARNAQTVMRIETALAKGALERVKRREPSNLNHPTSRRALDRLTPAFAWQGYFANIPAPKLASLNVAEPGFFKALNGVVASTGVDDLKTYLRWHLLRASAPLLPTPFVNADFDFYGRTLTGAKELRARWKRCVQAVDSDLGEDLGQAYVARAFGPESKQRMLKLVAALEKSLGEDIGALEWMSAGTKREAFVKLKAMANKIGYPDRWRDYSALKVVRGDALGNSQRANAFEFRRQLAKIGKPVDKNEWLMTPPTVNAYYDPQNNNINFPAGILQPPFFDPKIDDAVNFGAIGVVIGHELTHGFDDEGRQFDAQGNLRDWWQPVDAKEFTQRASCLVDQYSGYTAVADVKLNGKLTLGENTADNGGTRIAYMALMEILKEQPQEKIDGFTPEQRFFIGYGQIWCSNQTPEVVRLRALTDPHSKPEFRVTGVVTNMPEFQKAFSCPAKAPMVRENRCRVW